MRGAIAFLIVVGAFGTGCSGAYCEPGASSNEPVSTPDERNESDDPCAKVEEVDRGAKPIE
jgi:hypothetical protein